MKRLIKKSNHVEPTIHNEVEDKVVNPDTNINENQNPAFLLTKQLFAETAFVPAATLVNQFAKKIENGEYDYISTVDEAKDHMDEWLVALNEFIEESGKKKQ